MIFRSKKKYKVNTDTANSILQNVFAAESKKPNTVPFDKLVLREKANTRFYNQMITLTALVLILTLLTPLAILSFIKNHPSAPSTPPKLVNDYVEDGKIYLEVEGDSILYQEAYLETIDGKRYSVFGFDKKAGTLCFPYIETTESNIYIPTESGEPLHLLLTPQ